MGQTLGPATRRSPGWWERERRIITALVRMAREFYFGEEINEDDLKQFINLNTDVQFW